MGKISGLGLGEIKKISGMGLGSIKKISGLGMGLIWQALAFPSRTTTNGTTSTTASTTMTGSVAYPTGSVSGSLLIMQVSFDKLTAGVFAAPGSIFTGGGDWNLFMAADDTTASGVFIGYYWCIRGSETSVGITVTPTTGTMRVKSASIASYQPGTFDPIQPVNVAASNYTYLVAVTTTPTKVTTPAIITETDYSEVLLMCAWAINSNATTLATTWDSPATEIMDSRSYVSTSSPAEMHAHSIAYHQQATAGSSQTYSATPNVNVYRRIVAAIVINPVGAVTSVISEDFNTDLSNFNLVGGGNLAINGLGYLSGVGTPSTPMSYAFWKVPVSTGRQIVRATLRWNGNDPAHSAVAVVCRANPSLYNADGSTGAQFWCVNNLTGLLYETSSGGFTAATGTADYISTPKFPEGAELMIISDDTVTAGTTRFWGYMNGDLQATGTFPTSVIPTTNRYIGLMIQDDSAVTTPVPGGQPPACLDNLRVYTF